jgi:hypothetical protein
MEGEEHAAAGDGLSCYSAQKGVSFIPVIECKTRIFVGQQYLPSTYLRNYTLPARL